MHGKENYKIVQKDANTSARTGILTTAHGQVETPVFMPVGTAGAVKGITPAHLKETGATIILANTYHLFLRPGVDAIEKIGGIHKFTAWNGPILTDSGGYQVFSLSPLVKIDEEGVEFASHIDGAKFYLNAEITTQAQNRLGVDIAMCFDQCTAFGAEPEEVEKAVDRSIRWANRCKEVHANPNQLLFSIVQGGINLDLREKCALLLVKTGFDGYAIGGLSVGEGHENMVTTVNHTTGFLPEDKPRYLMGVGMPKDIVAAVRAGVDMFDCVLPTRNGRNSYAFTWNGPVHLRNNAHISDSEPIEAGCDCYSCKNYSRGAIRHFCNYNEMLGPILISLHNLRFYQRLMAKIRQTIKDGNFDNWSKEFIIDD
jgi:queuine tRNA-ribosyltransferase